MKDLDFALRRTDEWGEYNRRTCHRPCLSSQTSCRVLTRHSP